MTETAYSIVHAIPSVETYRHLRTAAGLNAKNVEAATRGLPDRKGDRFIYCATDEFRVIDLATCQNQ